MVDAKNTNPPSVVSLSPEILRARAQRRRETAERLWDERLERLLLEEAEELERSAAALELEAAVRVEEAKVKSKAARLDLAALRAESKPR